MVPSGIANLGGKLRAFDHGAFPVQFEQLVQSLGVTGLRRGERGAGAFVIRFRRVGKNEPRQRDQP